MTKEIGFSYTFTHSIDMDQNGTNGISLGIEKTIYLLFNLFYDGIFHFRHAELDLTQIKNIMLCLDQKIDLATSLPFCCSLEKGSSHHDILCFNLQYFAEPFEVI